MRGQRRNRGRGGASSQGRSLSTDKKKTMKSEENTSSIMTLNERFAAAEQRFREKQKQQIKQPTTFKAVLPSNTKGKKRKELSTTSNGDVSKTTKKKNTVQKGKKQRVDSKKNSIKKTLL